MRPLALFGGTFDPVHLGHLRAAWEAAEALDAEVLMVPAGTPPHRGATVATAEQRLAMLRAALAGQDRLRADDRELHREGRSYTVDTLRELRAEQGGERPLVLLLGADAFAGLASWHQWRSLFELAHIGVMTRPGRLPDTPPELDRERERRICEAPHELGRTPYGRIAHIPVTAIDISASAVRACLMGGREPRFLVPDAMLVDTSLLAPYRRHQ